MLPDQLITGQPVRITPLQLFSSPPTFKEPNHIIFEVTNMSILNRLHQNTTEKHDKSAPRETAGFDGLNKTVLKNLPLMGLNDGTITRKSALIHSNRIQSQSRKPSQPEVSPTWESYIKTSTITMIETLAEWGHCREVIAQAKVVALDTETTGLDPHLSRIRFLQIGIPEYVEGKNRICAENLKMPHPGSRSNVYIVDCFQLKQSEQYQVISEVIELIENPNVFTIFHHAVFDLKMLRSVYGKRFDCRVFDTMIASQLVQCGNFIPENQLPLCCIENHYRYDRQDNKIRIIDDYTQKEVNLTKDNQKYYKPYYFRHGLAEVSHRHLGIVLDKSEQTAEWSGKVSKEMINYAARDVIVLIPIFEILCSLLKINQLEKVAKIEFACIGATAEIEYAGMPFNSEKAQTLQAAVKAELNKQTRDLTDFIKMTGFRPRKRKNRNADDDEIQIQSNMEFIQFIKYQAAKEELMGEDSCEVLQIGTEIVEINTQKDTFKFMVARLPDDSMLKQAIQRLQELRKVKKRMEFLDNYLSEINPETERLHTSLIQLNPKGVGRFSSYQPNMQQVVNDGDIRSLFASKSNVLVDADYSAIEMRIMAQLSNDPKLIEAFENQVDIHKYTAANIAGIPIDEVGKEQRQQSKAINFGLIYGMSAKTLKSYSESSYGVVMTDQEAEESRNGFFRIYNHIASWQDSQFKKRYSNEFVPYYTHDYKRGVVINELPGIRTLSGRLRVWPVEEKISQWGNPYSCKVGAITELYNSPDQGSGADILKLAMGWLFRELIKRNWDDVQIIMTIHDELLLECPPHKSAEVAELLSNVMELAASRFIKVIPVEVEAVVMEDWSGK